MEIFRDETCGLPITMYIYPSKVTIKAYASHHDDVVIFAENYYRTNFQFIDKLDFDAFIEILRRSSPILPDDGINPISPDCELRWKYNEKDTISTHLKRPNSKIDAAKIKAQRDDELYFELYGLKKQVKELKELFYTKPSK